MKVIAFKDIDADYETAKLQFYPLTGDGEIALAAELARLSPRSRAVAPGETILVTHEWPCGHGPVEHTYQTYSLATYAVPV